MSNPEHISGPIPVDLTAPWCHGGKMGKSNKRRLNVRVIEGLDMDLRKWCLERRISLSEGVELAIKALLSTSKA